jgi:deoxyribonuclease-4
VTSVVRKPLEQRRIGFHVSIAGGFPAAVGRALERGCTCLQVFCGNPRGWALRQPEDEEIAAFKAARAEADLSPLFAHSCYLVNPCSRDEGVFAKSIERLAAELALAARIGCDCYVLHPGSHKGESLDWGIARARAAVAAALGEAAAAPTILLETMASEHGPGGSFETLGALIDEVRGAVPSARLGIALDTCHAFCAGHDFRDPSQVERLAEDVARTVGLDRLGLIHVNDSRDETGSRRDRHAHIGKGAIGRAGLRNLLTHEAFSTQPLILETPWVSVAADRRNLRAVRALLEP